MKYLVFDEETQTHHSHKRKANPFHPDNYVVMRGWKKQGDSCASMSYHTGKDDNYLHIDDDVDLLVGHNIKFDLLYEMVANYDNLKRFFQRGGRIWCTQYAEYLINAQDRKYHMNSMDSIIESYGGRKKIDQIKAMWDQGILTSDIDPDLLKDYLIGTEEEGRNSGDIGNTEKIFLGQLETVRQLGMEQAIKFRMDGLAATTEMEFRGLKIDVDRARTNLGKLNKELQEAETELAKYITEIPEEVGFNWGSRTHVSCIVFGGTIKYQKQDTYVDPKTGDLARKKSFEQWPLFDGEPVDPKTCKLLDGYYLFESPDGAKRWQDEYVSGKRQGEGKFKKVEVPGELKTKYQDFFYELEGYTNPDDEWKTKNTDGMGKPVYSVSGDVIDIISKRDIPFLQVLGRKQALDKEIGTYYFRYDEKKKENVGMLTCMQKQDHIVHHSLNHTSTVTSRLSANNPNAQNIPRGDKSEVKAIFVSRFGEAGNMVEADYSQLEVVVQGLLSGDKQLIDDLIHKIDFHCKRVALKHGIEYEDAMYWCKDEEAPDHAKWEKERTKAKIFSFQRAYGAGATLIAAETGMSKEEVEDLIENEDKAYPGIVKFNRAVEREVQATAEPFRDPNAGYRVFRKGTWQSPTGTLYGWRSYDAPSYMRQRGILDTFKPTELKNYPVQGTGGEIVQMILGILWRWFIKNDNFGDKAYLVNTVHDCVWVDTHKDVQDKITRGLKIIMESVPQQLEKFFGMDCPVPFPVDVEAGPNMLDLHHVEIK